MPGHEPPMTAWGQFLPPSLAPGGDRCSPGTGHQLRFDDALAIAEQSTCDATGQSGSALPTRPHRPLSKQFRRGGHEVFVGDPTQACVKSVLKSALAAVSIRVGIDTNWSGLSLIRPIRITINALGLATVATPYDRPPPREDEVRDRARWKPAHNCGLASARNKTLGHSSQGESSCGSPRWSPLA
jgi:hypothetical protein